jgi:hypothetical protein
VRRAQDDDGAGDRVAEDGERDRVADGDRGSPSGNADSRVMIIV